MLTLRFKNGRLIFRDGKLVPNCCQWKVTGYVVQILGQRDERQIVCENFGDPGCPACVSVPVLTVAGHYFNGVPELVVEAAVSGFVDINCKFDLNPHRPRPDDNPLFFPCVSTTVPWLDRVFLSSVCVSGSAAKVTYEFEDCPGARNSDQQGALASRDLRLIFDLEAR